jgi:hypothetical protein
MFEKKNDEKKPTTTPTIGRASGRGPRSTPAEGYVPVSRRNETIAKNLVREIKRKNRIV